METHHVPVLINESLDYLIKNNSGFYFDGTLGFGGYSSEILNRLDNKGKVISTDVDDSAFDYCKNRFRDENRICLYKFNFSLIDVIAKIESIKFFDGVVADLGVSSFQLDNPQAGFSYSADSPLDMRMDKELKITASDIVNDFDEEKIANIIYEYGEEKKSRQIARKIVDYRKINKIKTSAQLKKLLEEITPERFRVKTFSRVFQALRISVNDELENLKLFLNNAVNVLKPGGRLVLISYHSLEDRIVKEFFNYEKLSCVCPMDSPVCTCNKESRLKIITKKPVVPTDIEIKNNKRARSAKLRAAERT